MQKILKDFICFDFVCRYDLAKSELDKGKYMLAEENLHKQYSAKTDSWFELCVFMIFV